MSFARLPCVETNKLKDGYRLANTPIYWFATTIIYGIHFAELELLSAVT